MKEDNMIIKAANVASNSATEEDMKKINKYALKELTPDDVFTFKVKMADNSTDDRNFEPFTLKALEMLEKLYVGKTVGKDHQHSADSQVARIYATELVESEKTNGVNGEPVYDLVAKCYMVRTNDNEGLISEIEAGIKREVSTSCSCDKVVCSICGTDLSEKYCRHVLGRTYDGKICYRLLDSVKDVYELSFVAVPAQPQAGTFKRFDSEGEELSNEAEKTSQKSAECAQKEAEAALHIAEEYIYLESEEFNHE